MHGTASWETGPSVLQPWTKPDVAPFMQLATATIAFLNHVCHFLYLLLTFSQTSANQLTKMIPTLKPNIIMEPPSSHPECRQQASGARSESGLHKGQRSKAALRSTAPPTSASSHLPSIQPRGLQSLSPSSSSSSFSLCFALAEVSREVDGGKARIS